MRESSMGGSSAEKYNLFRIDKSERSGCLNSLGTSVFLYQDHDVPKIACYCVEIVCNKFLAVIMSIMIF